jgi:hypothetical protein
MVAPGEIDIICGNYICLYEEQIIISIIRAIDIIYLTVYNSYRALNTFVLV